MLRCFVNTLPRHSERSFVVTWSIWMFGSWEPNIRLPSIPRLWYAKETTSQYFQGFSPHNMPTSSIFWQRFNQEFFSCSFRILRSVSFWEVLFSPSSSYMGSGGSVTFSGGLRVGCQSRYLLWQWQPISAWSASGPNARVAPVSACPKRVQFPEVLVLWLLTAPWDILVCGDTYLSHKSDRNCS